MLPRPLCLTLFPYTTLFRSALQAGHWSGRTDILRRVEKPSDLGSWSYEVVDTKLARETKGSTVLQICLYSELVAVAQKRRSEEHTSELQSHSDLVCRLLLEK